MKLHLNIKGMTCDNCRERIEKGLRTKKGVNKVSVDFSKEVADIIYDENKISKEKIIKVISSLGYEAYSSDTAGYTHIVRAAVYLTVIILLYYILQKYGLLNHLVPKDMADTGMGYGMLFVIGLITSVHCIAMCGGIGLSQSLPGKDANSNNSGKKGAFVSTLSYNLGRVCSYTTIGLVLGFAGMILGGGHGMHFSTVLQGGLKIIAGIFMVIIGINMLGIFSGLRRISFRLPKSVTKAVGNKRRSATGPFIVGILNGFMPCGPLQSMWIVALATGNPFAGALSMFMFSLGTVPLMLSMGSAVSLLGKKFTLQVTYIGAILVTVMGLAMLSQGSMLSGFIEVDLLLWLCVAFAVSGIFISLAGDNRRFRYVMIAVSLVIIIGTYIIWDKVGDAVRYQKEKVQVAYAEGINDSNSNEDSNEEIMEDDATNKGEEIQVVNSTLIPGVYPDITVKAGVPVRWTIDAPEGSINGCNARMIINEYGIEHTFEPGENVIEFVPERSGLVSYTCWMGMINGSIYVLDDTDINSGIM